MDDSSRFTITWLVAGLVLVKYETGQIVSKEPIYDDEGNHVFKIDHGD